MSRRYLIFGLAIAAAVNLVVAGAFFWSRDGQRTLVEVESFGGEYRVLVDGKATVPDWLPAPQRVGVNAPERGTLRLELPLELSTMPSPGGIESIEITDAAGDTLFRDDFYFLNSEYWQVLSGSFETRDGVLVARDAFRSNVIQFQGPGWTDHKVAVTYRNSRGGLIATRVTEAGGAYYHFDLIRDFPNFLDVANEGERTLLLFGGFVRTDGWQSARSIAYMLTRPYPYVLAVLALGLLLTLLLAPLSRFVAAAASTLARARFANLPWDVLAAAGGAAASFMVTLYVQVRYYGKVPHVPDEVSYLFQAHLLTAGKVSQVMPPVREFFYFYWPPFLYEDGERWASAYPFGHPLAMALGVLFGAAWVMPSLIGAGNVALTYALGRRFFNARVGLAAAALLALSPFFIMQASSFMSHNTGAFYILASMFFVIKRDRPLPYGLLAGLFYGIAVNTRPFNMVALTPLFAVLLLYYIWPRDGRRQALKHTGAFIPGALLMGLAMLAYNYGITGDPLRAAYGGGDTSEVGFHSGHDLDVGMRNQQAQLVNLLLVFNGWPAYVGLAFVLLPFLLGTRNKWDYFCLAAAMLPIGAYILYRFSGIYEGPRYWFESVPFLVLLSARGAELAGRLLAEAASLLWSRLGRPLRPAYWAGGLLVYGLMLAFAAEGSASWLLNRKAPEDSWNVPYQASAVTGVFGVDDRLDKLANEVELHNALVLVMPCSFFESNHCYGSVFLRNMPDFDGDVVWARYIEGRNNEIIAAYPGREVYVAQWDPVASIERYRPEVEVRQDQE